MKALRLLAVARELFARGATIRRAAAELHMPPTTLYRFAKRHGLRRSARRLSPETRRQMARLFAEGKGGRVVAAVVGVSRRTAWLAQQVQERVTRYRRLGERSRTPLPCKPWRCPQGGELLNVTFCIQHQVHKPHGTSKTRRKPS